MDIIWESYENSMVAVKDRYGFCNFDIEKGSETLIYIYIYIYI